MKPESQLNPHELRRIAVEASCDPKTVRRFLTGQAVRPTCRARIESALRVLAIPALRSRRVRGAA